MASPTSERSSGDVTPAEVGKAVIFGAIGLGAKLVADTPRAVRQMRSDLVAARFIGEMAVTQGTAQVRKRLAATDDHEASPSATGRSDSAGSASAATAGPANEEPEVEQGPDLLVGADISAGAGTTTPDVEELAIPDYDTVPAIDVVMQLADLDTVERELIEAYERAHRSRRTILGKIDQLRDAS